MRAQDFHLKVVEANKNYEIKMFYLKQYYFDEWREFTHVSKEENYKEKVSITYHLKNLLSKVKVKLKYKI